LINKKILEFLNDLDKKTIDKFSVRYEKNISNSIKKIIKDSKITPSKIDIAEQTAFDYFPENLKDASGWGTYYGPMYILPNDKGQMVEYPSIQNIDREIILYWEKRAIESKNPLFYTRYADLVIDFSNSIINKNSDIVFFQKVIDGYVTIVDNELVSPIESLKKIKRALSLSIRINDTKRIQECANSLIRFEKKIAEDDKPGLWGNSLRLLILDNGEKVNLSEKQISSIVQDIEKILERLSNDTWGTKSAVDLLSKYYALKKDEENLMRVISRYEEIINKDKRINASPLLIIHSLEQLKNLYTLYSNQFPKAEKARKKILREIGNLNIDWEKSMNPITSSVTIKNEEIDNYLNSIFSNDDSIKLIDILGKISFLFIPQEKNLKEQLIASNKRNPLLYIISTQIIADDGLPLARLSPINDDYDSHYLRFARQNIDIQSFFLSMVIKKFKELYSVETIENYFFSCLLFEEENKVYFKRALSAYWDNDFITSSHLFIPLIETSIRKLIRICGGNTVRPNNIGGYDRLLLHHLFLQKDIFESIFNGISSNTLFYFKLVLTQKIGLNLRNDFAHGIGKKKFETTEVSDRLFHILICLSLVRDNG